MILFDNLEIFNIVDALTLKQIFWKTKPFLKTYTPFLHESFPYKTIISEANVTTIGKVSLKWTCQKERSFTSKYFTFFKKKLVSV